MTGFAERSRPSVAIVGAGPVGLYLALALEQAGVDVRLFEQRDAPRRSSRSIGIHPPSLELFQTLGIANRFVERGVRVRAAEAHGERGLLGRLDFDHCRPPFRFVLTLPQVTTESILREALLERAPGCLETTAVLGVARNDDAGVTLRVHGGGSAAGGRSFDAVIGCDGKESVVRKSLGIDFRGSAYDGNYAMADFPDSTKLEERAAIYLTRAGLVESFPLPDGLRRWVVRSSDHEAPDAAALVRHVQERVGIGLNPFDALHPSAFRAERYQAASFAKGCIALVGDAAQVVSPIGGQGMNLGWLGARSLADTLVANLGDRRRLESALARDGRARRRTATAAARRAELNMWIGRPVARSRFRDALVTGLLRTSLRDPLARLFTMRGLALGL